MIVTSQLLAAIQTALTSDATLNAIVPTTNIGTHLKDSVGFPHIIWGMEAENGGVKGQTAYTMTLVLDIWSSSRGEKQVWDVHDALVALFDRTPLAIASGTNTYLHFDSITVDQEGDGRTRHGTITFNLMVTE